MRHSNRKRLSILPALAAGVVLLGACGRSGVSVPGASAKPPVISAPSPAPGEKNDELAICTKLSLKGVTWPTTLAVVHKRSLALALNVSGSFEGSSGWKNITNNFDGQGLSLGLLNQCLGQGSLQPLLIKFRDRYSASLASTVSRLHRPTFLAMLAKWDSAQKSPAVIASTIAVGSIEEDALPDGRLSRYDELPDGSDGIGHEESSATDSVAWAKSTLYSDGGITFLSAWKKELQALSSNANYVTIQIETAMKIHNKALQYMKLLGLRELRSYLMLFDIGVQNGGLYQDDIDQFKVAFPSTGRGDETSRLKKILDLRIRHVVPKFKNDVVARKTSIINGRGIVHQLNRDYQREYCYDGAERL